MMKIPNLFQTSVDPTNLAIRHYNLPSHCSLTTSFLAHDVQRVYVGRLIDDDSK